MLIKMVDERKCILAALLLLQKGLTASNTYKNVTVETDFILVLSFAGLRWFHFAFIAYTKERWMRSGACGTRFRRHEAQTNVSLWIQHLKSTYCFLHFCYIKMTCRCLISDITFWMFYSMQSLIQCATRITSNHRQSRQVVHMFCLIFLRGDGTKDAPTK